MYVGLREIGLKTVYSIYVCESKFKYHVHLYIGLCEIGLYHENMCGKQGWEISHRFSERIARFLPKNERMSDCSKK